MATSRRIDDDRAFAKRAGITGAAPRARKNRGHTTASAANKLKVSESTYSRWERGLNMPTHHDHLGAYVRWLKRLGVEDDPAMRDEDGAAEARELESA